MKLILVSQDKKSIWDYSECVVFIPSNSIHEICIRPYVATNEITIATYEDPVKAEKVLQEIINVIGKSKMLLKPKGLVELSNIEDAKHYFEKLNNEKLIVSDSMFEIVPIQNDYVITYQLPEDEENDNSKE